MKLTETKNSTNKEMITVIVCITIFFMSLVLGFSIYNLNDRNNMAKNIDAAIAKGVDPISVKCAYETQPTGTCIAYALATNRK